MFVDASALCAILLDEPEAPSFLSRLEAAAAPLTSPVAVMEAVLSISRVTQDVADARRRVSGLLAQAGVQVVAIDAATGEVALDAHARYGKGRHPARLNMGDCFAYACARTHGAALLYKGGDFALTDLGQAPP